jgi:hypothetical protein
MNVNDSQTIQMIIDESLIAIKSGRETIDSILAKYPNLAQELRPDLEAALWLSAQRTSLEPRPGFISASRARLVAEIKQNNPTAVVGRRSPILAPLTQIFQRKFALQFALIFILFIGFISTGVVFVEASNRSIPGETLYTSKLVIEESRLTVTFNQVKHVRLEISYAERRSHELQRLVQVGRYEYIPQTVTRFDVLVEEVMGTLDQMAETRPEEALVLTTSLQEVVEEHVDMLTVMAEIVPLEVRGSIQNALLVSQSRSEPINDLLQKAISFLPEATRTQIVQASNTPLSSFTPTQLLTATATPTPTVTTTSITTRTPTTTPTPTVTGLAILPQPTSTATSIDDSTEPEDPTDTPIPPTEAVDTPTPTDDDDGPTPTDRPPNTHKPPTHTPAPDTPTPEPDDPTPIPEPTDPEEPPDPTDIPK